MTTKRYRLAFCPFGVSPADVPDTVTRQRNPPPSLLRVIEVTATNGREAYDYSTMQLQIEAVQAGRRDPLALPEEFYTWTGSRWARCRMRSVFDPAPTPTPSPRPNVDRGLGGRPVFDDA